jgi:hypothetical protein
MTDHIIKTLDISTAHLPDATLQMAEDLALTRNPAMQNEYGMIFHVPSDEGEALIGTRPGFNCEALTKIIEFARQQGCKMVMLDRDADTIDELPIYEGQDIATAAGDISEDEMNEAEKLLQV